MGNIISPCIKCSNCSAILKGDYITHPSLGHKIPIKGFFSCESKGVIYFLKCPCGLGYVGQTSRIVRTRITEHKSKIRQFIGGSEPNEGSDSETAVARHFLEHRHQVSDLKWCVLEQINTHLESNQFKKRLLSREIFWIHQLDTLCPGGLNEECNYNLA